MNGEKTPEQDRVEALKLLRGFSEMLGSEAWKLLDKHWELQQTHNQEAACNEKLMPDTRAIALGAFKAIKGMREYARINLPASLKFRAGIDLPEER